MLQVYAEILRLAKAHEGMTGSFFWAAVGSAHSGHDEFSICLSNDTHALLVEDDIRFMRQTENQRSKISMAATETSLFSETLPRGNVEICHKRCRGQEEVTHFIRKHAASINSLNSSWIPDCPVM